MLVYHPSGSNRKLFKPDYEACKYYFRTRSVTNIFWMY